MPRPLPCCAFGARQGGYRQTDLQYRARCCKTRQYGREPRVRSRTCSKSRYRGSRVHRKEHRTRLRQQETLPPQLTPPSVNLLPRHIMPLRNFSHRRHVDANRHDDLELLLRRPSAAGVPRQESRHASQSPPKTRRKRRRQIRVIGHHREIGQAVTTGWLRS